MLIRLPSVSKNDTYNPTPGISHGSPSTLPPAFSTLFIRNARVADPGFGTHDALCQRRRGHEKRVGNFLGLHTVHLAQREGNPGKSRSQKFTDGSIICQSGHHIQAIFNILRYRKIFSVLWNIFPIFKGTTVAILMYLTEI